MTPECERIRPLLVDAAAGDPDHACSGDVARHVAGCPSCAAALRRAEAVLAAAERLDGPGPGFTEGVMSRVARARPMSAGPGAWLLLLAVAAAVLVGLSLWLVLRRRPGQPPPPPREGVRVAAFAEGLKGTVRSAGRTSEDGLEALLDAGADVLSTVAQERDLPAAEAGPITAALRDSTVGLDEDLDDMKRQLTDAVSAAINCLPWL